MRDTKGRNSPPSMGSESCGKTFFTFSEVDLLFFKIARSNRVMNFMVPSRDRE